MQLTEMEDVETAGRLLVEGEVLEARLVFVFWWGGGEGDYVMWFGALGTIYVVCKHILPIQIPMALIAS